MKFTVIVVVVALAVVALRLLRRRRVSSVSIRRPFQRLAGPRPLGTTGLVAAREVRERARGRFFIIITLILLAVVAAAIVIPTVTKGSTGPQKVGVVGDLPSSLRQAVTTSARGIGVREQLVREPDTSTARSALQAGDLDLVIVDGHTVLVNQPLSSSDSSATSRLARSVASVIGFDQALQSAGLTQEQATTVAGAKPIPVQSLQKPQPSTPGRSTAVIGLILVFIMLTQYNTWTLMGIMEEKSSRVVEVLLAAVRPIQLLAGKVLGIGLVALAQAGLVVAFAVVLANAVGSTLLQGTAPLVLVATLVWLVLGYAFYCWVYAAAGSMAERQDQVQSLVLPLTIPTLFGYLVALTTASSGNASPFFHVLAFLPPTAPFAMPVLVGLGETTWWAFVLSAIVSILCTIGVARLAATIYRRAVLRTGGRVHLRDVVGGPWRSASR